MRVLDKVDRLTGALIGLALGAFDAALFLFLGTELTIDGHDARIAVYASFTSSLVLLGYLLGLTLELRRKDRENHDKLEEARVHIARNEKLASLGQLASAVAHEVRNPLAIIRSTVQNISEAAPSSGDDARFVMDEIDRLSRVVSTLVAFARPIAIAMKPTPCAEIVQRTALLAVRMLGDRRIELRASSTVSASVEADRDLVCQVLLGLLGNAADVTEPGGFVELGAREEDRGVVLTVSDRGPGVPKELVPKIFDPFFTTKEGGTGLGLAVARQIVKAHDGEIYVENRTDGGACFSVLLRRTA
jgi:signal transduction histidine kinase